MRAKLGWFQFEYQAEWTQRTASQETKKVSPTGAGVDKLKIRLQSADKTQVALILLKYYPPLYTPMIPPGRAGLITFPWF